MEGAVTLAATAWTFDRAHRWITGRSCVELQLGVAEMISLAIILPLLRPSAMFVCVAISLMLLVFPVRETPRGRWFALAPLAGLVRHSPLLDCGPLDMPYQTAPTRSGS